MPDPSMMAHPDGCVGEHDPANNPDCIMAPGNADPAAARVREDLAARAEDLRAEIAEAEVETVPLLKPGDVRVGTDHIRRMLRNALMLAEVCHGAGQWVEVEVPGVGRRRMQTIDALEVAAGDAIHAFGELMAERRSLTGYPQT